MQEAFEIFNGKHNLKKSFICCLLNRFCHRFEQLISQNIFFCKRLTQTMLFRLVRQFYREVNKQANAAYALLS